MAERSANMRRLFLASLVTAPLLLALGSTSASACGWYGYRGCGCYAPRVYGYSAYRPVFYRSYYAPRFAYGGFYRPRVVAWRGWGGRAWGWRGGRRW